MVLNSIFKYFFKSDSEKAISYAHSCLKEIKAFETKMAQLTNEELLSYRDKFKAAILNDNKTLDNILPEAFAVVKEVAFRQLNMKHFDSQIIGGIILHRGMIAEMNTGEGKTFVATLPAYLNAITGQGVHIITVNDYLAKRDSEWMRPVFEALGLTVGCIDSSCSDLDKKDAYKCDIVYGTNNELGFDYLRDNMKGMGDVIVQNKHHYALIDEVDSVLIDEARTPLIISGSSDKSSSLYKICNEIASKIPDEYCEVDLQATAVIINDDGISFIENELSKKMEGFKENQSLYDIESIEILHHINQALRSVYCFKRDQHYIVKNGKVLIIDAFTGRLSHKRYSDGLHQALEAKENVAICKENRTLASITFQSYFKLYNKLSGMTGTASSESQEFSDIYGLKVCKIPTNKPVARKDLDDEVFLTKEEKYEAIKTFVIALYKKKQPVLIGTSSISNSEELSRILSKAQIKHNVLNAKFHEDEANIIAQAGRPGVVTIATNMAGRGTDIMLGGNPDMILKGKDPNSEQYKEIVDKIKKDKQIVLEAGGLCVIGTERHESRRIDNQLRGRSGRQGDIGMSIFFVSMEDELMRAFGTDRIAPLLKKLGMEKGQSIKHSWISKSIERAQKKIENRNYEARKNLFKYDSIINKQREIIYGYRAHIISSTSDEIISRTTDSAKDLSNNIIDHYLSQEERDSKASEEFVFKLRSLFQIDVKIDDEDFLALPHKYILNKIQERFSINTQGVEKELIANTQKHIWILFVDFFWRDHLLSLEYLRENVGFRAMGNKDPFNEFNQEAFLLFEKGLNSIFENVVSRFFHISFERNEEDKEELPHPLTNNIYNKVFSIGYGIDKKLHVLKNAKCHCGSGLKYEQCCKNR